MAQRVPGGGGSASTARSPPGPRGHRNGSAVLGLTGTVAQGGTAGVGSGAGLQPRHGTPLWYRITALTGDPKSRLGHRTLGQAWDHGLTQNPKSRFGHRTVGQMWDHDLTRTPNPGLSTGPWVRHGTTALTQNPKSRFGSRTVDQTCPHSSSWDHGSPTGLWLRVWTHSSDTGPHLWVWTQGRAWDTAPHLPARSQTPHPAALLGSCTGTVSVWPNPHPP